MRKSKKEKKLPESTLAQSERPQVDIVPLGGLGEVGMNMMVYSSEKEAIIVDCGVLFPEHQFLGIDQIVPHIGYLKTLDAKPKALFLTHGHEDHIGAAPYLLKAFKMPVYATRFTLALLESKLAECDLGYEPELNVIAAGDTVNLNRFRLRFHHVNHSICDAVSLSIETRQGLIVHTGDFRIDQTPLDGDVFDFNAFADLGKKGIRLLLSDSTNSEREGATKSEVVVYREIDRLFDEIEGKIFVTLFASSIPRIQSIADISIRAGRKIHIAGRSLETNVAIAEKLGLLHIPQSSLISAKDADYMRPQDVTVMLTGSQGEPRSVLSRVAMGNHKDLHVRRGDGVIFSSRIIPGRGRAVSNIINHLLMRGAKVCYEKTHEVHTSGHAHQEELRTMINLTKPDLFVPIHGEYHHLATHAELAKRCGVAQENVCIAQDGDVLRLSDDGLHIISQVDTGRVYVSFGGAGTIGPEEIRERRKMAQTGMVVALVVLSRKTGEIMLGPEITSKGLTLEENEEDNALLLEQAKEVVLAAHQAMPKDTRADAEETKEEIRLALRRFFNRALNLKPVVIPIIVEM